MPTFALQCGCRTIEETRSRTLFCGQITSFEQDRTRWAPEWERSHRILMCPFHPPSTAREAPHPNTDSFGSSEHLLDGCSHLPKPEKPQSRHSIVPVSRSYVNSCSTLRGGDKRERESELWTGLPDQSSTFDRWRFARGRG